MDYFLNNWGSFASVLGLLITIVMVGLAVHRAGQAQKSATAAKVAAEETQKSIAGVLTIVDLERAIAMVQRLKTLHRDRKWEVSLELYQPLRVMLTNINTRGTIDKEVLRAAVPQIRIIEDSVTRALSEGGNPTGERNFPRILNNIQTGLEEISSAAYLQESEVR